MAKKKSTQQQTPDNGIHRLILKVLYSTRGSQKVLGNPLLTENERKDSACSDVVVSLACLLSVATGLVRFRR
jgi:hypothetical protein